MAADYQGSVEEVHRAFTEAEYWLARLADFRRRRRRSWSRCGSAASPARTAPSRWSPCRSVHSHNLPGLVTQLHRGDLCIRREESWGPVSDGSATAIDSGIDLGRSGECDGHCRAVAQCRVGRLPAGHASSPSRSRSPLIGGKMEKLIGSATGRPGGSRGNSNSPRTWITQQRLIVAEPKLALMRIALAQILSGTDPAANLQLVREYTGSGRRRGREAGGVPGGDHVPFRRPAGTDRRARRRALGRRCPTDRDRRRHHRDRRHVHPGRATGG